MKGRGLGVGLDGVFWTRVARADAGAEANGVRSGKPEIGDGGRGGRLEKSGDTGSAERLWRKLRIRWGRKAGCVGRITQRRSESMERWLALCLLRFGQVMRSQSSQVPGLSGLSESGLPISRKQDRLFWTSKPWGRL